MEPYKLADPRLLDWQPGSLGQNIAQLMPGSPNTTLDRTAIGDGEASDVLNCSVDSGDWRLDDRYRQFCPSPIAYTGAVCTTKSTPTTVMLKNHDDPDIESIGLTAGGVNLASPDPGWGYWNGVTTISLLSLAELGHL